jgi:hypothetical protein
MDTRGHQKQKRKEKKRKKERKKEIRFLCKNFSFRFEALLAVASQVTTHLLLLL